MANDHFCLREIYNNLVTVKCKWYQVGIQLKVPVYKLEEFKKEVDPLVAIINYWLKGNMEGVPLCWESIITVLKSPHVEECGLAETINKKFCQQKVQQEYLTNPPQHMDIVGTLHDHQARRGVYYCIPIGLFVLLFAISVQFLIHHRQLVNNEDWSALMHASQNGHTETAKLLLGNGVQINFQNNDGWSVLMFASSFGHSETVKLLIENGAQLNLQSKEGWSALMLAISNGHSEIVKVLLENGAQLNLQTKKGWSALMLAISNGHSEIVKVLLENGAQLNLKTKKGWSALMLAISCTEVVKLLLENGAQVDLQTNEGWTALMLASSNGHSEIVKLLLENGAQLNLKTKKGWSALMIASQSGHSETVKLLIEKENLQENSSECSRRQKSSAANENKESNKCCTY